MLYPVAIGCIVAGGVFLLFGYKLIKVIIFISGFISGFNFSFMILGGYDVANGGGNPQGTSIWINVGISLLVGVACGFTALCCVKFAVFLVGFIFGSAIVVVLESYALGPVKFFFK